MSTITVEGDFTPITVVSLLGLIGFSIRLYHVLHGFRHYSITNGV